MKGLTLPHNEKKDASSIYKLLSDPWYRILVATASLLHEETARFFSSRGIGGFFVPVTTGSISSPMGLGSDSLPVRAIINGKEIFLADSQQFLLELGLRLRPEGVYYVSSSLRGEDVDRTHLSEFTHTEVEIKGSLDDIIQLASDYVTALIKVVLCDNSPIINYSNVPFQTLDKIWNLRGAIPRIRYEEVFREYGRYPQFFRQITTDHSSMTIDNSSITREGEQQLIEDFGGIVWLTHLPQMACPFYQAPEPDTNFCLSADLLFGVGEVLGSGERCKTKKILSNSLRKHAIKFQDYSWYLQMKDISPLRTAGFGLGMERFLMGILGCKDIRKCTPWIREHGKVVSP